MALCYNTLASDSMDDVLFGCNVSDTNPVFPGSMGTLFLTISGIEICCMYNLCDA